MCRALLCWWEMSRHWRLHTLLMFVFVCLLFVVVFCFFFWGEDMLQHFSSKYQEFSFTDGLKIPTNKLMNPGTEIITLLHVLLKFSFDINTSYCWARM